MSTRKKGARLFPPSPTPAHWIRRFVIYVLGLMLLAAGITMNTMTGLGVSPIVSVPYNIAQLLNLNFANTTFAIYVLFVIIQLILRGRDSSLAEILQILVSILFTRFMNLVATYCWIDCDTVWKQGVVLVLAVVLTGIGVALSTSVRLVPNPGDGIVQAISDKSRKSMGFTKNVFDGFNMLIGLSLGLIFSHRIVGIGIGTLVTFLGTGRVVAVFQHFLHHRILMAVGLEPGQPGQQPEPGNKQG